MLAGSVRAPSPVPHPQHREAQGDGANLDRPAAGRRAAVAGTLFLRGAAAHCQGRSNVVAHGCRSGQLQQRPTAREGGLFKRQWFANPVKFAPSNLRLVRSWDFASSVTISNDPDWTVGLLMGLDPHTRLLYVVDVIRARLTPGQRQQRVRSTALLDGDDVRIRIPQDPGGAGKFEAHHFVSILQGYSVSIELEQGTKERRADPFAAQCEHGFVKLVEGSWNKAFIDELCAFPNGSP